MRDLPERSAGRRARAADVLGPVRRAPKLPDFLTLTQAAERLQLSTRTLTRAIAAGELHAHKLRRQIRISADDLTAFVAVHRR